MGSSRCRRSTASAGAAALRTLGLVLLLVRGAAAAPAACGPADDSRDCAAFLSMARAWPSWWPDSPSAASVCSWPGATCAARRVSQLNLSGLSLQGTVPPEIGLLSFLDFLDLTFTGVNGALPETIGQLTLLEEMRLGSNNITGTLPASLRDLSVLAILAAPNNSISGVADLPRSLAQLDLRRNRLPSIPAAVRSLPNLQRLDLRENPQLSGALPQELCSLGGAVILFDEQRVTNCVPSPPPPRTGYYYNDEAPAAANKAGTVRELMIGFVVIVCGCIVGCAIYRLHHRIRKLRQTVPELFQQGLGRGAATGVAAGAAAGASAQAQTRADDGLVLEYDEEGAPRRPHQPPRPQQPPRSARAMALQLGPLVACCFPAGGRGEAAGWHAGGAQGGAADGPAAGPGEPGPCVVCLNARADHAIYPCGHLCLCRPCSVEITSMRGPCPVCRGPAADCIRIFFAG